MLKIKLARFGKRNQPHFRIVVNEARDKRDGKYVVALGHYAPTMNPKLLEVDLKVFDEWIAKGAIPTETVASLVERFKSGTPFPPKKAKLSKKAKAKLEAAKTAKEEASKAPAAEPVVEAAPEAPAAEEAAPEVAVEATAEPAVETTESVASES